MSSCKCESKSGASQESAGNCCSFQIDCQCHEDQQECDCTALVTCGVDEDGRCCKVECKCTKGGCKCKVTRAETSDCSSKDGCSCKVTINCKKGDKNCCECVCIVKGTSTSDCKIECAKPDPESGCVCECKVVDLAPGEKGCCKVQITCKCK